MENRRVIIVFGILIFGLFLSLYELNRTITKSIYSHASEISNQFSVSHKSLADLDRDRKVNTKIQNQRLGIN